MSKAKMTMAAWDFTSYSKSIFTKELKIKELKNLYK